jgi:hypothetical protein
VIRPLVNDQAERIAQATNNMQAFGTFDKTACSKRLSPHGLGLLARTHHIKHACTEGSIKANTSSIQTSWVMSHLFQLTFLWVFAYIYMTIAGRLTAPLVVGTARCSSYHRLDSHIAEHAIKPEVRC